MTTLEHERTARLRLSAGGDIRARGGAITMELCGHWEHEGPCRWPHRTDVVSVEGDVVTVVCRFDAATDEVADVASKIDGVLDGGRLTGPDGRTTTWARLEA